MGKASGKKEQKVQKASPRETRSLLLADRLVQPRTVLLFLSLLAVLIYSKTFLAPFHFDDSYFIVDNPEIKNFSSLLLSGSRYVSFLSLAVNYRIGGLNTFGYHLVNLVIHVTSGFLVYIMICFLFKTPRIQSFPFHPDRSFGIALSAAFLFVAHPIQTSAVTYVTQRFASLSALFYLLAVASYLKWRLAPPETGSRSLWYGAALFSTVLAMKAKEIAFTLPFMILLVEAVFFGPFTRKRWITLIPFLLTLCIIPLSRFPEEGVEAEHLVARETTAISRLDYLFTQFRVILTYLRLLVLPVHQNLDYDYPIYHSLFEPQVFFSFLFLSALLGAAVFLLFFSQRSTHSSQLKLIGFGMLWFFLTLSIESSVIPIRDVIDEYRLYLPSVGFLLACSAAVSWVLDRRRGMRAITIGVAVVLLSVATYQRNLIWKEDLTLWSDVVRKSPHRERGHLGLGNAYEHLGRFDEAIEEYKTALTLKPNDAEAYNNLGNAYLNLGRIDESIQEYKTALTLRPNYSYAHYNLGVVYQKLGRFGEAIQEYEAAITLTPGRAEVHNNLGNIYSSLGRGDQAIREFITAVTLDPDNAESHNNLGIAYGIFDRLEEAAREFQTAIRLSPNDVEPHVNLGNAYRKLGSADKAIEEYKTVLTLKPNDAKAHYNLGLVYQKTGRLGEAAQEFEQALQINPGFDPARQALMSLQSSQ